MGDKLKLLEKENQTKVLTIERLSNKLELQITNHFDQKENVIKEKIELEKKYKKCLQKVEIQEKEIDKFVQENSMLQE